MYSNYQIIKILNNKNMNCFSWVKLISVLIHFKYCNYNIHRASLLLLQSPSNFTLANYIPSSTQSSSYSSSVSLFCATQFNHTPQLLDIPNHIPIQANQICYQAIYKSQFPIGQTRYLSKS